MEYKLIIQGRLCGLNEYIATERANRYKGAEMKRENENIVIAAIRQQLRGVKITKPVYMEYTWIEKNKRRDLDNITFGRKFIQDALVKAGVLKDDGWKGRTNGGQYPLYMESGLCFQVRRVAGDAGFGVQILSQPCKNG